MTQVLMQSASARFSIWETLWTTNDNSSCNMLWQNSTAVLHGLSGQADPMATTCTCNQLAVLHCLLSHRWLHQCSALQPRRQLLDSEALDWAECAAVHDAEMMFSQFCKDHQTLHGVFWTAPAAPPESRRRKRLWESMCNNAMILSLAQPAGDAMWCRASLGIDRRASPVTANLGPWFLLILNIKALPQHLLRNAVRQWACSPSSILSSNTVCINSLMTAPALPSEPAEYMFISSAERPADCNNWDVAPDDIQRKNRNRLWFQRQSDRMDLGRLVSMRGFGSSNTGKSIRRALLQVHDLSKSCQGIRAAFIHKQQISRCHSSFQQSRRSISKSQKRSRAHKESVKHTQQQCCTACELCWQQCWTACVIR